MITPEKFKLILDHKIDLNLFYLLETIKEEKEVHLTNKVQGWLQILVIKGLLSPKYNLTSKGLDLIIAINGDNPVAVDIIKEEVDFDKYTLDLLAALKAKLKEIIGKDQVMGFGNTYFIPGIKDLREFLLRFSKKYSVSIEENAFKIQTILLRHVEKCAKARKFSPAVKYFIIKDGTGSSLEPALENFEEESKPEVKEEFKIINSKNLFG
jgi:hypothetical protein